MRHVIFLSLLNRSFQTNTKSKLSNGLNMKKIFYTAALLLMMAADHAMACTNFIVGKDASADGSVFVTYNADSYGMYGNMYRHVGLSLIHI